MPNAHRKPGRNDPCPCGSGNKYKRCCGAEALVASPQLSPQEISALVALLNQERFTQTEEGVTALLKVHPHAGMLWKILSVARLRQGKDALQALRRAAELMPNDGEAHGNLGAALHQAGLWSEALASLQRALAIVPQDIDSLVNAADALRALGRASESISFYQRALTLNLSNPEAHNNLGNAFLELGQYEQAIACYHKALQDRPHDAQIYCNLCNAQERLRLLDEALLSARQAVALEPTSSLAHGSLGRILAALGQRGAAVASFQLAVELNPKDAQSLSSLGDALFDLRKIDEAAATYVTLLELEPQNVSAHLSLSVARRAQRRQSDAEANCEAALSIQPNFVEAISLLGELRADRGRFGEAEVLFKRAIKIDPEFSFAFSSIATHRKMTLEDSDWLSGAQALLEKRLPLEREISLRYALGKYHDDIGQYAQAFEHYRHANELSKQQISAYDGLKFSQRIDSVIRHFDAAGLAALHSRTQTSDVPVFIIGMPRSGTSLAEQILASHPAAFGAGEISFWEAAYIAYRQAEVAGAADAAQLAELGGEYLDRLTASSGEASRVIDKMPANFLYAGLIHAAFPRARIIHMQRDPIDTCVSIYFQNFFNKDPYATDLESLAHYYGEYRRSMRHWRSVLPSSALLEIPYESLIADQEGWTRRMLDFVGLPWDAKCLQFHETERVVITASKWQVRQKMHSASAGRWRHYEPYLEPLKRLLDLPA